MFPPIFQVADQSASVHAQLGNDPLRFFPFGEAPQNVELPYATWQQVYGNPENFLGQKPDLDTFGVQIDVYALTATSARETAQALRDALEPSAHIVRWGGESRDPQTRSYRVSFDIEFLVSR